MMAFQFCYCITEQNMVLPLKSGQVVEWYPLLLRRSSIQYASSAMTEQKMVLPLQLKRIKRWHIASAVAEHDVVLPLKSRWIKI
jgi:hypothetical protein